MLSLAVPFAGAIVVLLTILHILICVFLIFVVLLQRGRNQDLASAFGGGQTQANLAAMSTDDFLTRATKITAFAFMFTSLLLAIFAQTKSTSVLDEVPGNDVPTEEAPAEPASAPAEASAPAADTTEPATEGMPATDATAPASTEPAPASTEPASSEPAPASTEPASTEPAPAGTEPAGTTGSP